MTANFIRQVFDEAEKLGLDWANSKAAKDIADLFADKIERGEIEWVADKSAQVLAEYFESEHLLAGPWGQVAVMGFSSGVLRCYEELSEAIRNCESTVAEGMERHQEILEQSIRALEGLIENRQKRVLSRNQISDS